MAPRKSIARLHLPRFHTKDGSFSAPARFLGAGRSIAILQAQEGVRMPYCAGTVLRRQRVRNHEGSHWTVHLDGVYSAFMAELHIARRIKEPWGDLAEMNEAIMVLPDYARSLFAPGMVSEDESRQMHALIAYLTRNFGRRWNKCQIQSTMSLIRTDQELDSRGRQNPGARAMATGGAIHALLKRREELKCILSVTTGRSLLLQAEISRIVLLYQSIEEDLRGLGKARHGSKAGILARAVHAQDASVIKRAQKELARLIRAFRTARVAPFTDNVTMILKDLRSAQAQFELFLEADVTREMRNDLLDLLRRLRTGAVWARAMHEIQMRINVPLSMLLHDAEAHRSVERKAVGDGLASMEQESYVDDERAQAILGVMKDVRAKLCRLSDAHLRHPVKETVLPWIEEAIEQAEGGDWLEARDSVRTALSYI